MNKEILRLAIPNILSNISVPLLSTVDTALMGRLSAAHIAAVGIGGMIFNFIYWNFGFLRMGTTGLTAQAYGAKDRTRQANIIVQALTVAVVLAVLVVLFSTPLMYAAEYLLNLQSDQTDFVRSYFFIRIWDAPASMILYSLLGWLFGMQNAIYPLILTISINLINILISYVLVTQYQMDIQGVAWGTVIAQYFGVLLAIILIRLKYKEVLSLSQSPLNQSIDQLMQYLTVNRDIFLRTVCLTLGFGVFYSQSALLGSELLAANVVLLLFVNWMSYAIDGFAYSTESLVGKYRGQQNDKSTKEAIKKSFFWAAGVALLITSIYAIAGDYLTTIFTDQPNVIAQVGEFRIWIILFPILAFVCYIWDGVYIGLTATQSMRNAILLAFLLYLPSLYIGSAYFGNHGVWAGLLLFMIYRGLIQTWFFYRKGLAIN